MSRNRYVLKCIHGRGWSHSTETHFTPMKSTGSCLFTWKTSHTKFAHERCVKSSRSRTRELPLEQWLTLINRANPQKKYTDLFGHGYTRAANLWNIISVFCWKNFRILSNFSISLNLFLTRLKTFIRQLPIYSGGTHPLPVETLVDSFSTTGTGSEARKRVTTTCGREKIECFGD